MQLTCQPTVLQVLVVIRVVVNGRPRDGMGAVLVKDGVPACAGRSFPGQSACEIRQVIRSIYGNRAAVGFAGVLTSTCTRMLPVFVYTCRRLIDLSLIAGVGWYDAGR